MLILIGCEESQAVTIAFRNKGHEAFSCDIQGCSGGHPEWHIKGDVLEVINSRKWDMGIFFTPCTFSANSGVRWFYNYDGSINQDRYDGCKKYATMLRDCLESKIKKVACENPIPHKHALWFIGKKYNQIIQPWQFGHGEQKATCLWLKGLPELQPTNVVQGREQVIWKMPPSPDRAKLRSKTYKGIAEAMADQWGNP
jgi:hypothetical protein